jgi:hypothetical protein
LTPELEVNIGHAPPAGEALVIGRNEPQGSCRGHPKVVGDQPMTDEGNLGLRVYQGTEGLGFHTIGL